MVVNVERQIRWDRYSEDSPERHNYIFLIINRPRQIDSILQKLREQLTMVVEETEIGLGLIRGSGGLHYDLREISSTKLEPDFSRVYGGEISKDRRLQPRKTSDGWNDFINKVARGNI